VEAVEEEGEVGGGLGGEAVAFETHVVGQRVGGFPAVKPIYYRLAITEQPQPFRLDQPYP
jgi:hypothetical protein